MLFEKLQINFTQSKFYICNSQEGFTPNIIKCHYSIFNSDVNFCLNYECQNGGTCWEPDGTYPQCICPKGYTGVHCETGDYMYYIK